ncbi:ras-related protein Rab-32B-like isoform X2 [Corticium candelabrum]|nr:ras-related protein Rab-32B-like isoform X2 [Corticium candelabrum]
MTRVYYKYAIAAIIVYDLSRPATFDSVLKWHKDVNQKVMLANEQPVPILLLANKCDLEDAHFDPNQLDEFCKEHKFTGWFPTSAKDNQNVDDAMTFLVTKILSLQSTGQSHPQDYISLKDRDDEQNESEGEDEKQSQSEEEGRRCCNI